MKKEAQKVEEPAGVFHASKRSSRQPAIKADPAQSSDDTAFRQAVDKVSTERQTLLRKLAQ